MAARAATAFSVQDDDRECPICFEIKHDIEILPHEGGGVGRAQDGRDISSHRACKACREDMRGKDTSCPWCRDRVVWDKVISILDGLKSEVGRSSNPDQLANLMTLWEEFELTRPNSDVVRFAKDMISDDSLSKHVQRAIDGNPGWIRDSMGLWARFHCLVEDGELRASREDAQRLRRAVHVALDAFDRDGGNAPEHGGAMVAQVYVAVLCAMNNGMSVRSLVTISKRVAATCIRFWSQKAREVRSRLPGAYVESLSSVIFGSPHEDPLLRAFFPELMPPQPPPRRQRGRGGAETASAERRARSKSPSAAAGSKEQKVDETEAILAEIVFAAKRSDVREVKRLAALLE
eukprot:g1521.t1